MPRIDEKSDNNRQLGHLPTGVFGPDTGAALIGVSGSQRDLSDWHFLNDSSPASKGIRVAEPCEGICDPLDGVAVTLVHPHEHLSQGGQVLGNSGADGAVHWSSTGMS
ncbi:hypothetical protein BG618_03168 [Pseudonocardia autotrophica]|nr:hypothetical protein BG618_03168 [Pseudonocardia autotrophica]